jgi:hypothetical protein
VQRQIMESMREASRSASPEASARIQNALKARRAIGSLAQGGGAILSMGAKFEDAPASCVEALGDYAIDQDGITFLFATGLPGDLNRFVIERGDIDEDHGRLHFARGDCRFEITIGAEILHNGQWIARSVAPFLPSAGLRIDIRRSPDSRPPWLDRSE